MSHYAHVVDNRVQAVIVADQEFVQNNPPALGEWIQTSYNTHAGVHPENRPLRKNFAGLGYTYNAELDAFIPPRPYDTWVLNTETGQWQAPFPPPIDGNMYAWDPMTVNWKKYNFGEES
jgi:hypothetical protein